MILGANEDPEENIMKYAALAMAAGLLVAGCAASSVTAPGTDGGALARDAAACQELRLRGVQYPSPSPSAGVTDPVRNPWTAGRHWPQDSEWNRVSDKDAIGDPCVAPGTNPASGR